MLTQVSENKVSHRFLCSIRGLVLGLWCLTPLSTLFQYRSPWAGFELTTLVVLCTDCTYSCKSNYHKITTTTTPCSIKELMYSFTFTAITVMFVSYPWCSCHILCILLVLVVCVSLIKMWTPINTLVLQHCKIQQYIKCTEMCQALNRAKIFPYIFHIEYIFYFEKLLSSNVLLIRMFDIKT